MSKEVERKYVLTDETKDIKTSILYRIKAVKDFGDVKKGDLGGWVAGYANLSHDGLCWVYDDAIVTEKATVSGNAKIRGNAFITDRAVVSGWALVTNNAMAGHGSRVYGHARIMGSSSLGLYAEVYGYATVAGNSRVSGNSKICGHALVMDGFVDCGRGEGKSVISGNAQVYGNSQVSNCIITDGARVYGSTYIHDITLCGMASVGHSNDAMRVLKDGKWLYLYRLENGNMIAVYEDNPTKQIPVKIETEIVYNETTGTIRKNMVCELMYDV